MSIDERATLTNMVAELGGFTGIVEPDEKTVAFLKERRNVDFTVEGWMKSDAGATYADVIRIDAGEDRADARASRATPAMAWRRRSLSCEVAVTSRTAARARRASARTSTITTRCCAGASSAA